MDVDGRATCGDSAESSRSADGADDDGGATERIGGRGELIAVDAGDEIKVRPMMYLALSYDHRVVDGREAVSFLVAVKDRLEAPDRLLIEV